MIDREQERKQLTLLPTHISGIPFLSDIFPYYHVLRWSRKSTSLVSRLAQRNPGPSKQTPRPIQPKRRKSNTESTQRGVGWVVAAGRHGRRTDNSPVLALQTKWRAQKLHHNSGNPHGAPSGKDLADIGRNSSTEFIRRHRSPPSVDREPFATNVSETSLV